MSKDYLVSSGFCITHNHQQPAGRVGGCGLEGDGKECVFDAVPVKQTSNGASMSEELIPDNTSIDFLKDGNWHCVFRNEKPYGIRNKAGYILFFREISRYEGQEERYKTECFEVTCISKLIVDSLNATPFSKPTFTKEDVEKALQIVEDTVRHLLNIQKI